MKKTLFPILPCLLLICIFPLSSANGQVVTGLDRDSLLHRVESMPEDTAKVQALILLGQQFEGSQPGKAKLYYKAAEKLSEALHYEAGFIMYAKNYTAVLNIEGIYDSSLEISTRALVIARKHGWQLEIMKILANIGTVYQYKEAYQRSLDYYLQALQIAESLPSRPRVSLLYNNISALYRNLNQPEKAEVYARKALAQAKETQDLQSEASALNNLANSIKDRNHIQEAKEMLERCYAIGITLDDINLQETSLINIGDAYIKLHAPDKYLAVFQKALPLADSVNDVMGKALILQGIGEAYYWTKRYDEAWRALEEALAYAREHDQKEVESRVLLLMSDAQIALAHPELSEGYRLQHDSVRDILMNATMLKNIQELETKYAVEKSRQLAERQRFLLVASIAALVLLSGLLFFSLLYYRQRRAMDRKALLALQTEQENVRLRSVLEGETRERRRISQEMHDDMGSGLTSLLFLSRTITGGAGPQIGEGARQLITKMNEIIWSMNDEQDTLDSLVAYIRTNAASTLDTAGIDYTLQTPDVVPDRRLGQAFRRNIYLVVKEAIHNIVRHAGAELVQIGIETDTQLRIVIRDNGKGIDPAVMSRFGNGMKNMQRRMQMAGGTMTVRSENGTLILLEAPWPL